MAFKRLVGKIRRNRWLRKKIVTGVKFFTFSLILLFFVLTTSINQNGEHKVIYSGIVFSTAYNSLPNQTDSSPWTTALGTRCREGVIASNFLPFGTKVKLEGFGDRIFIVEDRMNKRFYKRIDIWFRNHNEAIKFGGRRLKYYVIESV